MSSYFVSTWVPTVLDTLTVIQVFYHLGGQNEAMQFALCAGSLFTDQLATNSDYIDTLTGLY
jgi:hypothetical protein